MQRRKFIQWSSLISSFSFFPTKRENIVDSASDRAYWVNLLDKISAPILKNMSKGELRKNMTIAFSPTWDKRPSEVAYMEAFGRMLIGIGPFLALPDDESSWAAREETNIRRRMKAQALASLSHAANP